MSSSLETVRYREGTFSYLQKTQGFTTTDTEGVGDYFMPHEGDDRDSDSDGKVSKTAEAAITPSAPPASDDESSPLLGKVTDKKSDSGSKKAKNAKITPPKEDTTVSSNKNFPLGILFSIFIFGLIFGLVNAFLGNIPLTIVGSVLLFVSGSIGAILSAPSFDDKMLENK